MIRLSKIVVLPRPTMYTGFYPDSKSIPLSVDLEFNIMGFMGELFEASWAVANLLDLGINS